MGLNPTIRLMTPDGFAFEDNDCLSVALEQSIISSKVLGYQLPILSDRYVELCKILAVGEFINFIINYNNTTFTYQAYLGY